MQTRFRIDGDQAEFIIEDLDPRYHQGARDLAFVPVADSFVRRFPAQSPHSEAIYARFAACAEELILQRAGARLVPWDRALTHFLQIVDAQPITWMLVGSAALAVRGIPVEPGDVDLAVDSQCSRARAALLHEHLIEPVSHAEGWIADRFGRSFLGARVEWVAGVHTDVDEPHPADFGPIACARREATVWRGHALYVPPLDLQLAVSERRGLAERAALIRRNLAG